MDQPEAPERDALFWQTLLANGGEGLSRRDFARLLGASMALSGVGCSVGPAPGDILPYASGGPLQRPGLPVTYATTLTQRGYGVGVLVKTHEGRATKVEGNLRHPGSLGGANAPLQASVLGLYDPDRLRTVRGPVGSSAWATWFEEMRAALGQDGAGCAVLASPWQSPFFAHQMESLRMRYEALQLFSHLPTENHAAAGGELAFGAGLEPVVDLSNARVVVSLDCDFLLTAPGALRHARAFAATADVHLACVESALSLTGTRADARLAVSPDALENTAVELLRALAPEDASVPPPSVDASRAAFIAALAQRIRRQPQGCVFMAGAQTSPLTHACVTALNGIAGAVGHHVQYRAPILPGHLRGGHLDALLRALDSGTVQTLLVLGGNPVHDAPGTWRVAERFARAPKRMYAGQYANETAEQCGWHLPVSHALESWGDAMSEDGAVSLVQPVMQPLYETMSMVDIVGALAEPSSARERSALAAFWAGRGVDDAAFGQALTQGTPIAAASMVPAVPVVQQATLRAACAESTATPARDGLTVLFRDDNTLADSDDINNAWLQELSDPISKESWGNAAWISEATAETLGVTSEDWIRIEVPTVTMPAEIPHVGSQWGDKEGYEADTLGKKTSALANAPGAVGDGGSAPVDARKYAVADGGSAPVGERGGVAMVQIACPVVVVPGHADHTVSLALNFGHTAAGLSVGRGVGVNAAALLPGRTRFVKRAEVVHFDRPAAKLAFTQIPASWHDRPDGAKSLAPAGSPPPTLRGDTRPARFATDGPQWGMAIDLDRCTGCQACVVACQAENNIPVVGAVNVRKGRAMHWLRIDRYFARTDDLASATIAPTTAVRVQPMLCQHCEHAPCEYVCPVGATQHSPDGLNEMVYNRCVGTRYCSNNCPYKVRRFNWFAFHNETDPVARMVHNPDVTVRARGIMEKCTFCVQRIRGAQLQAKLAQRPLQSNDVVTACQQTCPSEAIVFGDLNKKDSPVQRAFADSRATIALAELGTRPRVRYLKSQG